MTLDVAVATYGNDGMKRVEKMLLPPKENVRYVISWQEHNEAPIPDSMLSRDDIEVWRLNKRGLSNNRNNAIEHCHGDIVLIADDDLAYEKHAFAKITNVFENDPHLDLATFRVNFHTDKHYPPDNTRLKVPFPKNYWVSSVEIAFRRERLKDLKFNPLLGLGAPKLLCGEEELFVIEAIRARLNCRHISELICSHPHMSTGAKVNDGILLSNGFMIRTIYPLTYPLRIMLKAYRLSKAEKCDAVYAIRKMIQGSLIHLD